MPRAVGRLTGQHVTVVLGDAGEAFPATVEAEAGASLTLVAALTPPERYVRRHVVVQYTSARGMHRLEGALDSDPARPEVLRLAREGAEVIQRRDWARVDAVLPLRLRAGDRVTRTSTLNISAGGALAPDPLGLPVDTPLAFELTLGDGDLVPGTGVVASRRPGRDHDLIGIRFDVVAESDRERLVRFAMERQRLELRLRRGR